ncbi:MAG: hypothetical protein IJC26_00490 [Clostridia bacterium]|nr:hypothetical protein [Clostridia bacterium]
MEVFSASVVRRSSRASYWDWMASRRSVSCRRDCASLDRDRVEKIC